MRPHLNHKPQRIDRVEPAPEVEVCFAPLERRDPFPSDTRFVGKLLLRPAETLPRFIDDVTCVSCHGDLHGSLPVAKRPHARLWPLDHISICGRSPTTLELASSSVERGEATVVRPS